MKNKINNLNLIKEYVVNEISSFQLAKKYNCSNSKIRRILKLNNIRIRNCKESQKKYKKRIIIKCKKCNKSFERQICACKKSKQHFCSPKCFYAFNIGINNANFKHGKSDLAQNIHLLKKYRLWREQIFKRDNFICQRCGKINDYFEVHHIKSLLNILKKFNITNTKEALECSKLWKLSNGLTLCKSCHNKMHPEKGYKK